ncbi:APC family permease [Streptomyces sp. SID6648]|nr:APC family permease [Streptomyces sp. SID6648]
MAGFGPLAFVYGGAATPSAYLLAGAVYLLFTVGFAAMSRHVSGSGAFYAYITRGIGIPVGAGSAMLAYVAYALGQIGFVAAGGLFLSTTLEDLFGFQMDWAVAAVVMTLVVGAMAHRRVELGAKVMGVLLTCEVGVLLVLAVAVLAQGGHEGLSAGSFDPGTVFTAGLGTMLVIPLTVFIGFEQTAIYSEEAKDPRRTVARATYIAVAFLAAFYTFTSWVLYMAIGPKALASALSGDVSGLVFTLGDTYAGTWLVKAMEILMVTSYLAGVLALHNAASRYLFAQGRERLLPRAFGRIGDSTGSPAVAGGFQVALVLVALLAFRAAGLDPYRQIVVWTNTPTLIGVIFLQVLTSIAVIRYLGRLREGESLWQRLVAPALSVVLLATVLYLVLDKIALLTGEDTLSNTLMMLPLAAGFMIGLARAWRLRSRSPEAYVRIGTVDPFTG